MLHIVIINLADNDSNDGEIVLAVIPKVWNHLCLISFTYSAGKSIGTLGIKHSVKFLLPYHPSLRTFLTHTHIMDTVSFKLCRLMKRKKVCEYLKIMGGHRYIFGFLHTPLCPYQVHIGEFCFDCILYI